MNVCFIYSPNWLKHVYVELYALLATNPQTARVYLLSDAAGAPSSAWCDWAAARGCELRFLDLDARYQQLVTTPKSIGRFSKYALYRLLIPEVIPEERLLYVDTDALVTGDLSDLYAADLTDCDVVGVRDTGIKPQQLKSIGLPADHAYINAGVMLMNLQRIRQRDLMPRWLDLINTKALSCFDQDCINLTCDIRLADPVYNASICTGLPPLEQVKIAHYAGHLAEKGWCGRLSPLHNLWAEWEERYDADSTHP